MSNGPKALDSVCVYCGSSDLADPQFLKDAGTFGSALAAEGLRLVYGGGGVGLMGACARAAHAGGGRVFGIIPDFLVARERAFDEVETRIVTSMHERKMIMFEQSDGFVVLPGGIGTLEEIVELLSWRRLNLHAKPIVIYNPRDFWRPMFDLYEHTIREGLTPPDFTDAWCVADTVAEIIPLLRRLCAITPTVDAHPDAREMT